MPISGEKKPLHLAKSVGGLNKLADTPTGHKNLRILAKSTQMLLKNATESLLEGDQEKAYVLFMRFFNVVSFIKKSRDYKNDKKYYDALIGDKNCMTAIEKAEELAETLKARYDELEAMELSKKLNAAGQEREVDLDSQDDRELEEEKEEKTVIKMIDPSAPSGWVKVQKLYEWFKNGSVSILLVDVRSREQFDSSHMTSFQDIINAPDIIPGSTAKNVEVKLSGSSLTCWSRRGTYDAVVVCDLDTNDVAYDENTSPLMHLKNALVRWDLETKLKCEPLFLLGGYREWVDTFPMFVNKLLPPGQCLDDSRDKDSQFNGDTMKAMLDSISYDIGLSYLDAPQIPTVVDVNMSEISDTRQPLPNVDRSKKPRNEITDEARTNDGASKFYPTNDASTAFVAPPQKSLNAYVPSVNRSLKPSVSTRHELSTASTKVADTQYETDSVDGDPGAKSFAGRKMQLSDDDRRGDVRPRLPGDGEVQERLRKEIEELEEKKRSLEQEVADFDRMAESGRRRTFEVQDSALAQEKAKQARELAELLREKKRLTQELKDMARQKQEHMSSDIDSNEISANNESIIMTSSTAARSTYTNFPTQQPKGMSSSTQPSKTFSSSTNQSTVIHNRPKPEITSTKSSSSSRGTAVHSSVSSINPQSTVQVTPRASPARDRMKPPLLPLTSDGTRLSPKRYTTPLKDEGDGTKGSDSSKSNLKRSHSFPNIAKLSEGGEEGQTPMPCAVEPSKHEPQRPQQVRVVQPSVMRQHQVQPPSVDRTMKPTISHKLLLEAKVRNFQPLWGATIPGLTGLRNLGNTCYMNSIVQCLSNCIMFCQYFIDNHYNKDINWSNQDGYRGEVAIEFASLMKHLWCGQYKAISPYDFRAVVSKLGNMFASSQHQDAQELLEFLMNGLNEDLNRVKVKPQLQPKDNRKLEDEIAAEKAWLESLSTENSVVVDLFRGQYKSQVMCSCCGTKSTVFEPFMSLTLQIPENQSKCSLADCLLHFSNEEKMAGDSKWLCPQCRQKREATKRIVIWRLPKVLIVHLKRFHYQGIWRNKISSNVTFPTSNLDMARYLSGPRSCESNRNTVYNLFAVCNHYGTLDGGHYTAYCKNAVNCDWFKFDDSDVSEISPSSIQSPAAYLLFYVKTSH